MTPLRRGNGPSRGPVVISLTAGLLVLIAGLFVNGCRISKLLSRPTEEGEGGGAIIVTPPEVLDSALAGETLPRVASVAVSNGGTWVATTGSSWIDINPSRGGARATVRLSLHPQGLAPGLHIGSVRVAENDTTGAGGGPSASVTVSFRIQQPVLDVKPSSFSFTPHSTDAVFNDTLEISNAGDGPLVWSAVTEHNVGWLTLTNTSGTGEGKIAIRATNAGLPYFGTFNETIIITAPGAKDSPKRVTVTMRRRKHDDGSTP